MGNDNYTRKSLAYSKGITTSPSDLLSGDDELTESVGILAKDGALMPTQESVKVMEASGTLVYIHKGDSFKNAVFLSDDRTKVSIYAYNEDNGSYSHLQDIALVATAINPVSVSSVANTLLVTTEKGIDYLLFKGHQYKHLGNSLPKPQISFFLDYADDNLTTTPGHAAALEGFVKVWNKYAFYDKTTKKYVLSAENSNLWNTPDGKEKYIGYTCHVDFAIKDESITQAQDAFNGNAALVISLMKEKNYFAFPFFLRYALRLFDGSYARISVPIIAYPSVSRNCYFSTTEWSKDKKTYVDTPKDGNYGASKEFLFKPKMYKLEYKCEIDGIEEWTDIVKEVVVFASDFVLPFKIDGKYYLLNGNDGGGMQYYDTPVYDTSSSGGSHRYDSSNGAYSFDFTTPVRTVVIPEYKTEDAIIDELISKAQFYKLFSVDAKSVTEENDLTIAPIKEGVVSNLEQQEQLSVDDYYGWTDIVPNKIFSYNRRANLFGVKRFPFEGESIFNVRTDRNTRVKYKYYFHIVSDSMDTWVCPEKIANTISSLANTWIYYPDPNATEAVVWDTTAGYGIKIPLKIHKMLNGAYAFNYLPLQDTFSIGAYDVLWTPPETSDTAYETFDSQIFTSVVNNPFVFQASGDNTVGTGSILGIAANTEAVSQGQFGQYPLLVFTTEGIYGMSVNSEGLYSASYPISREVCNNADSITPTDKLVFFTSAKGLMAASGGSVVCVSEQMRGRNPKGFNILGDGNFLAFIKNCRIAYDYRDSLLRIFSPENDFHYMYSIADHTFGKAHNHNKPVLAVANDYPDNLIQEQDGSVYSLFTKPDINEDNKLYSGTFITRPLKFGSSITLKSLGEIQHLVDSDDGSLSLRIFASNSCREWCELHSLHGKPWAYYVFRYDFKDFKACDSFAGTLLSFLPRFTDRMR